MQGEVRATGQVQQDVAQTSAFLLSLFQGVCSPGQAEHPYLLQTLAMCLGDYAAWFGRCTASLSCLQESQLLAHRYY